MSVLANKKLVYADQVRGAILRAAPTAAYVIDQIPAVEAKPIIYGKWLIREHDDGYGHYFLYHCSECDCQNANQRNYCPECGATMEVSLYGNDQQ